MILSEGHKDGRCRSYNWPTPSNPECGCWSCVAAFVGLRKGELLGLQRGDIDLAHAEINISRQRQLDRNGNHLVGPPKTQAGIRTIAIPETLTAELEAHLGPSPNPASTDTSSSAPKAARSPPCFAVAWSKPRTKVGLPDLHFHDLRHLAGTLAATTDAGTKEIMHRLGHSTHQAALRYQHATRQRDRTIATAINDILKVATKD